MSSAMAALAACPDADVIFVAHAGLDTIVSVSDVWRRFPVDQVICAKWWRVPFDQVPSLYQGNLGNRVGPGPKVVIEYT